jgi:hypothetical protein
MRKLKIGEGASETNWNQSMNDRQRKRSSKLVTEFFSVCSPDVPAAEIERIVASLSDEEVQALWKEIFVQVTTDNTRYAAEVCSRNGWFIDMEFPGVSAPKVADLYENGQIDRADSLLVEYYRGRYDSITEDLTAYYSKRSRILLKAFRMHSEREYDISVPLFLIQADGICTDVFQREFFRIKRGALAARKSVDGANVDWVWNAIAQPFRIALPIATHTRDAKFLNRHLVLHGQALDYGTEINSLKAISLLSFLYGLDSYRARAQATSFVLSETIKTG